MRRAAMLFVCLVGLAFPASKAYEVVPYENFIGTQEDGEAGITQTFVMTVDSLTTIWLWVGDKIDSDVFHIVVREAPSGPVLAQTDGNGVEPTQSWSWLPCPLYTTNGKKPKRGRTYKATVTREGGAEIDDPRAGA